MNHPSPRTHRLLGSSLTLLLGGALLVAAGPQVSASPATAARKGAAPERLVAAASAHGSLVTGNRVVGSGETAHSSMCTTVYRKTSSNRVAGSEPTLAPLADLGAVETKNVASKRRGVKTVTSTARVARGSLFEGRVTFEGLSSLASVATKGRGYTIGHRVDLAALAIDGNEVPIGRDVQPATYEVPGLGRLHVNYQSGRTHKRGGQSLTEVLRLALPDGTSVRVGRSYAKMNPAPLGTFRGAAWGSDVSALDLLGSGPTGHQPLPCRGTGGRVLSNDTANVGIPGLVRIGTTTSTAQTRRVGRRGVEAVTSANVADVQLGGGRITVDAIRSRSRIVRTSNGTVARRPFSRVLGLIIDGEAHALPVDGRVLEIPGLARIESGLVASRGRSVAVTALRVTLFGGSGNPVVVNLGNSKAALSR